MAVHRLQMGVRMPPNSGRSKGAANRPARPVKDFLQALVDDPEVQESIRRQIFEGRPGAMQAFLEAAQMVMGRPRQRVQVELSPDLAELLFLAHQESQAEREDRASQRSSAA